MREIIILAGPDGAGKTSFANEFMAATEPGLAFVNADELARGLGPAQPQGERDIRAARIMPTEIERLTAIGAEFMFETTLASLTYATHIPAWRAQGYRIGLIYLRLPDPDASIKRVARRVAAGGHGVPAETIRRRFARDLANLEARYKPLAHEWYVYDSLEGAFRLAGAWENM